MLDDPSLLLIGHGSAHHPDAGEPLLRHVATLRRQGHRAAAAFLNGTPTLSDTLLMLGASPIHVVPCFMEDGYFTRTVIPRVLADSGADDRVSIMPPIGLHPMMPDIIQRQATSAAVARDLDPASAILLLIGHGSASHPGRPLALHRHAAALASRGGFARIDHACLEEAPFLADQLAASRSHPVIVVGYFANHGEHVRHDVPRSLTQEHRLRGPHAPRLHFAGNVVDDHAMTQIILDQAGAPFLAAGD